ncbi:winged helix-turn-helix domain-containing protein [Dokdonella sp.]|uniref:winged helix-turn-helix domain-containing protein n=1 Tax=Dokdonella sp. TaxID=2291710 RepID=UPI001B1A4C64|nr:winged helix-turn-helix domain-containing protein [Dokdonella sp.]MBO9661574.1 winged helix-turn-helix domain-containing protein [Dokdonella sp.]
MSPRSTFRFGAHVIDLRGRRLRSTHADVPLEPKVFDCLAYLIEQRGRAVGRDELIAAVWGKVDVSDAMLGQAVLKARRAIGDDGRAQQAIRTVSRFGYQWVAPIEEIEAADEAPEEARAVPEEEAPATEPPSHPAPPTPPPSSPRSRRGIAVAAVTLAVAAAVFGATYLQRRNAPAAAIDAPQSTPHRGRLVLALPMRVRSAIADDAWLRLGLLALLEPSLRGVPGVELMSADAAIAAAGKDDAPPDLAALRTRTRAAVVVTSEAQHRGAGWAMSAKIDDGARTQQVEAEGSDAVGTAAALADRIRQALDPRPGGGERRSADPAVRELAARMQAALYAGQGSRALELADAAPATAAAPDIAALRAQALLNLGRYDEMQAALGALALSPDAHWRATALVLRAKSEVERGTPEAALRDLRAAIDLLDPADDRPLLARALSGLGLTQLQTGDVDAAEASLLRARMTVEPAQQPLDMARSDQNLGIIAVRRGRHDEAAAMFQRAADAFAAFGMVESETAALINVGIADLQRLDHPAAIAAAERAGRLGAGLETGELRLEAGLLEADALAQSGRLADADARYAAIEHEAPTTAAEVRTWAQLGRASLALGRGDAPAARASLDAAPRADDPRLRVRAAVLRLRLALAAGDRGEAAALAGRDELREPPPDAGGPDSVAARVARAQWLASVDDANAAAAFDAALALARRIGSPLAIRDAAAPYADFRLARGDLDAARTLAALVAPYAERDFDCARSAFEVARAGGDLLAAERQADAARRLAGERPFAPERTPDGAGQGTARPPPAAAAHP